MMLDRVKAKRAAVEEELALHKAVINNLINKLEVYNEIITEEEELLVGAAEESIDAAKADCEESGEELKIINVE